MRPSGELDYSCVVADKIHWKPKHNLIEKTAQADVGNESNEDGEMSFFALIQPPAHITAPSPPGKHDDERRSDLKLTFEFGLTVKEVNAVRPSLVRFSTALTLFVVAPKCGRLLHGRYDQRR